MMRLALAAAGACLLAVEVASAQDMTAASPSAPDANAASELAEITVTATRREEKIDKVPISIVAFSREALEAAQIKNIGDLATLTPGVQFDVSGGYGPNTMSNIAIRGVSSTIGTSTTGVYLDDTPIQSRIVAQSYFGNPYPLVFDLDRVEVERGPQGTLFGAGAEGGALRFISTPPSLHQTTGFVHAEASITDRGAPSEEIGAAVGGPIIAEDLGYRVSAWARQDGGYIDRVDPFTGANVKKDSNSAQSYVLRGALSIKPADWLAITPSAFGQYVHNDDSNAWYDSLSDPAKGRFSNGRLLAQPSNDRFSLTSMKVEATLEAVTITSVSSYFHRYGDLSEDGTNYLGAVFGSYLSYGNPLGYPYPASYADAAGWWLETDINAISQEIRVTSNNASAALRWTAGVFFSNSSQTDTDFVRGPFYAVNLYGVDPNDSLFYTLLTSRDQQYAAFGQIDYRFGSDWTLTAGLRVSRTITKLFQVQSGPVADTTYPVSTDSKRQTPVTPKLGLSYQLSAADMVYASVGKGYRVGGGNQPIPLASSGNPVGCPLPAQPGAFSSDSLWSYELGTKDRLFGGRLHVDASLFYVDWRDIQQPVNLTSCAFSYIGNIGRAFSRGFDLATSLTPFDSATVGLSVTYTDARFTEDVSVAQTPIVLAGDAVGGLPQGVASPWNLTVYAEYVFPILSRTLTLRAEDVYRTRNPGPFNTQIPGSAVYAPDLTANPAYNLLKVQARMRLGSADLTLYGDNVLNRHPPLYRFQDTSTSNLFTNTTVRPLTVGASLSYKF
jgi:iron complex outermembrane recepter protein